MLPQKREWAAPEKPGYFSGRASWSWPFSFVISDHVDEQPR
jgi:hypothetical protein